MLITILGTRGEVDHSAPYHSRHSGILINGALLVDAGEREFLSRDPKAILITHLHPDHAYFVRSKKETLPTETPVFAPEKIEHLGLKVLDERMNIAGFSVQPIPTRHSVRVKAQAYLIEKNSEKLLYTGDMVWIEEEYHSFFDGLDLVITEGSYFRKGGLVRRDKRTGNIYGHAGIPDLVNLFKDYCGRIVIVHLGSWFYRGAGQARKRIKELARKTGLILTIGYDNMELDTASFTGRTSLHLGGGSR